MTPTLYWVEGPWKGRLAISARPRGNDWLEEEIKGWRASGVTVVASLLTPEEVQTLGLDEEAKLSKDSGLDLRNFSVEDRSVPMTWSDALDFMHGLEKELLAGKNVAVHCRQGLGRSALVAAGLLVMAGISPELAIKRVSAARGCPVPETAEQSHWVAQLAHEAVHQRH